MCQFSWQQPTREKSVVALEVLFFCWTNKCDWLIGIFNFDDYPELFCQSCLEFSKLSLAIGGGIKATELTNIRFRQNQKIGQKGIRITEVKHA